jgi:hypothetical protein
VVPQSYEVLETEYQAQSSLTSAQVAKALSSPT